MPVLAAACGQAGTSQPSTAVSAPVAISAWFPVSGVFAPYLQGEVEQFQQGNQRVKVTLEGAGAEDKLQAAVIAGDPPDIQHSNYIPMFNWVRQNALEPIDPYLDRRGKADFHDWAREGSTVDGKMYEWPWMLNPTGVIVNRSLFGEKNATHLLPRPGPKADWTIDQWRAALRAVTTSHRRPRAGRLRHRLPGRRHRRRLLADDVPLEQRGRALQPRPDQGHHLHPRGGRRLAAAGRPGAAASASPRRGRSG